MRDQISHNPVPEFRHHTSGPNGTRTHNTSVSGKRFTISLPVHYQLVYFRWSLAMVAACSAFA